MCRRRAGHFFRDCPPWRHTLPFRAGHPRRLARCGVRRSADRRRRGTHRIRIVLDALPPFPAWGKHAGVSRAVRAPTQPTQSWLRRHGARQRAALAAALRRAEGNSGFRRAADACDAAALLTERPQGVLELVAAIVLARDGLWPSPTRPRLLFRRASPIPCTDAAATSSDGGAAGSGCRTMRFLYATPAHQQN